jgi:hypothetical protein
MGNFCPFAGGACRGDCVFKSHNKSTSIGILDCLIVNKLDDINGHQHDDLVEIIGAVSKN